MAPEIGIVVPSYNDRPFLESLVGSLYSAIPGVPFSLTIVDDHSTDDTPEWVVAHLDNYASYIRPEQKSYFTRCVNFGLHFTHQNFDPNFYLILNSDITVTDYWGAGMIGTAHKHDADMVGATLLNPNGTIQHIGAYGPGQHIDINRHQTRFYDGYDPAWVTGAAMMVSRSIIETIGMMPHLKDAVQYDGSDREYARRALQAGFNIAVSPATLYHHTHTAEHYRNKMGQYNDPNMRRLDR